jgi:hypothetical protein
MKPYTMTLQYNTSTLQGYDKYNTVRSLAPAHSKAAFLNYSKVFSFLHAISFYCYAL